MLSPFREGLRRYLTPEQLETLGAVRVGVAGCGGIGSNVVLLLARSGVRRFLLVDDDRLEPSNLNRQQYFAEDLGKFKADALAERLRALSDDFDLTLRKERITPENLEEFLSPCGIWIEAMDGPENKRFFVEGALRAGRRVIACSGLAGWGGPALTCRRIGRLSLAGDGTSGIDRFPPLAPRVAMCAALMADEFLCLTLGERPA